MNGYEATRYIRLLETGRGEPNLVRHVIHRHEEERR